MRGGGVMAKVTCPDCGGDGKETCHNPDHGFISAIGGEIGRLGCPCCGHDERHKVKRGGACDTCGGPGEVDESVARLFCEQMDYDFEEVMSYAPIAKKAAETVGFLAFMGMICWGTMLADFLRSQ